MAFAHIGDAEVVADIVQDSFARALQQLAVLRDAARFRPWLLAIARHVAVDRVRAASRLVPLDDDRADALASSEAMPDTVAVREEVARRVSSGVVALSERDATAVALVTQHECTAEEVGTALGVTPGTAKVIVHRARRRLRNAMIVALLAEQPWLGCDEFVSLSGSDPEASSRHLLGCGTCISSARVELLAGGLT